VTATLLRNARIAGSDAPRDLLVAGDRIRPLGSQRHDDEVDLESRFVGPGLWDAHVHVAQWALRSSRLDVSSESSALGTVELVRAHLRTNPQPAGTVLVGQGFRDGLWPDEPTAELLDAVDAPVALVSGDVHTVWSNAAALRIMGLPESDRWLREQPAFDLNVRLSDVPAATLDRWVLDAAERAAVRGVVGIRDFEFDDAVGAWLRRFGTGFRGLRVDAQIYPAHLDAAIAAGYRTGAELGGLLTVGRLKLFTDGSLNTRTAWCDDEYPGLHGAEAAGLPTYGPGGLLTAARVGVAAGIVPTIHAIGDRATAEALDAFEALELPSGSPRGSIQHAQLVRDADLARFARLGVVASVQPEHAMDDRDVADHYWAGRTGRSFPLRSLLDAGAELELGSDAPVAPLDPWVTISAAVTRRRDGRDPWHPEQAITVDEALRASQGGVDALEEGGVADLVVTDEDPRSIDPERLSTMPVHATMVAGEWSYGPTS
jgi:predicted amidohydrolase YtcJ